MGDRPKGWTVLGSGAMAEEMRGMLARDPDLYAPETWSIEPRGVCPCCEQEVFSCKTRHTNWDEGFATHANISHPKINAKTGKPDPNGTEVGCCCVAPSWGPRHDDARKAQAKSKRKSKRGKASR